jgi:glycosyltransferase involved in cell wall biosynthesis
MSGSPTALPRVAIVLATYNGEDFLRAQLDSLLAQDYRDFVIVARDDGSHDTTLAILQHYAGAHPGKFQLVDGGGANLGASASFSTLIQYVLAHKELLGLEQAYMLCCDQDDVWYSDKISKSVQAMLALETKHPYRACLVHSDLRVIDAQGQELAPSFFVYQGIRPHKHTFARMLVSNSVTGCTAMMNEKLAEIASPIPAQAIMHDWWLALVASSVGHVQPIDEPLMDYRQHQKNTLGAKQFYRTGFAMRKLRRLKDPQYDKFNARLAKQAENLAGLHYANLKNRDTFVLSVALWMNSRYRWVRNGVYLGFIWIFA